MKNYILLVPIILTIITGFSFSKNELVKVNRTIDSEVFDEIKNFPTIKDTADFISKLESFIVENFDADNSPFSGEVEKIENYEKLDLYGSKSPVIILELSLVEDAMITYPWRAQLLFNLEGKLLKFFNAENFSTLYVHEDKNPYLILRRGTAKGFDGDHVMYQISNDEVKCVYESEYPTYIANMDAAYYDFDYVPSELNIYTKDMDKDGFKDVIFYGHKIEIDENEEITVTPVELVMFFNRENGKFEPKKGFSK